MPKGFEHPLSCIRLVNRGCEVAGLNGDKERSSPISFQSEMESHELELSLR